MSDPTQTYCNQSSHTILKFVGVYTKGLNRLHDAIDAVNEMDPLKQARNGRVELLNSKFSKEQNSYIVEVQIPFQTSTGEYNGTSKVPQAVIIALLAAVNEFQPQ